MVIHVYAHVIISIHIVIVYLNKSLKQPFHISILLVLSCESAEDNSAIIRRVNISVVLIC